MLKFVLGFHTARDLQIHWQRYLGKGFTFLQTLRPFPTNSFLSLILKMESPRSALVIPARVIQIIPHADPEQSGMVVECVGFKQYEINLANTIATLMEKGAGQVFDFSKTSQESKLDLQTPNISKPIKPTKKSTSKLENENLGKAERLALQAAEALTQGDLVAAHTNLRLALVHDPRNAILQERLETLQHAIKKNTIGSTHTQMEKLLKDKSPKSSEEIQWLG